MHNNDDIHLKLLANVPINIDGIGQFQLPTLKEIIQMDESKYNANLALLLFSKASLKELSKEALTLSDYELMSVFTYSDISFRESMFDTFRLFLNSDPKMLEDGTIYFNESNEDSILTEEKWEFLKEITRIGNFIQEKKAEDEYNPANEQAKRLIEMLKKNRNKKPKKVPKQNLHSLISALTWKPHGVRDVLDLTIYQLYDGIQRLENMDNYHYVLTGIYTGNIDGKKINLPDINWANILKTNN